MKFYVALFSGDSRATSKAVDLGVNNALMPK